jgi:peptide/nickel transport system permease protein
MGRYLERRLLLLIPVILGVITLAFFMMHLSPGDPARVFLGPKATQHAVDLLRLKWGLDQSVWQQYLNFLGQTFTGNLGDSLYFSSPILSLLAVRLPVTLMLMLMGALFAVVISLPLAVLSATSNNGVAASVVRTFNALIQGMPAFFIGSMLILLLGVKTHLFPAGGYPTDFLGQLDALVLPALTIALGIVPLLVRSLNAAMRETFTSEFVAFGLAKGLSRERILAAYVLRNSSVTGISILGIQVGALAGGALVVEQVFALPGMGSMLMTGILSRDYPVVQACTLAFAILVVLVYLATDLIYAFLDPRVRLA